MNMGLDMYAFSVKKENVIDTFHIKPDNKYLLYYWRKHPNLHGQFKNLYYSKGGKVEPFSSLEKMKTLMIQNLQKKLESNRKWRICILLLLVVKIVNR